LLSLTKFYLNLPEFPHVFILVTAVLQAIQIFLIFSIKSVYSIYILKYKPEMLEVRNSPLNRFGSQIAYALYCAK
jgi:hypothetical protein